MATGGRLRLLPVLEPPTWLSMVRTRGLRIAVSGPTAFLSVVCPCSYSPREFPGMNMEHLLRGDAVHSHRETTSWSHPDVEVVLFGDFSGLVRH